MASRKGLAPQVMAYWLMSASMAWTAALFKTAGAGNAGKPWARLLAPLRTARRVISRITDSVNWAIRWLRNRERVTVALVGTHSRVLCREGSGQGKPSIGDHVDLTDTALDFDVDLVRGALVGRADPVSFLLLEPADADAADAAVGLGINPGIGRNANRGFADTPMDGDVIAVLGRAAQIHIQLTDAHVQFHAAEVEAAQIEPRLAGAEVEGKVHRGLLVELQIPVVFRVAEPGVVGVRLFDGQRSLLAGPVIAHLRFPGRDAVGKIAAHQLGTAIGDAQISSPHFQFDAHHLGIVHFHAFRRVLDGRSVVADVHHAAG